MKPLDFELLFEFSVNVAFEPQRVGDGPAGKRQIFPIVGMQLQQHGITPHPD